MMKKLIILLLFNNLLLNAQEPFYKTYKWNENQNFQNFEVDQNEDIISFKDKSVREFYYSESSSLIEVYLVHRILWLNSDDRIEQYNKIYLPYDSNSELLDSKARVITSSGVINELDKFKILTAKDEETNKTYKYFALEGIDKGSFIEYYYIIQQKPAYNGTKVILQSSFNMKNVEFDLYSPKNLIFDFKSYNGLNEVKRDTLEKDKLHWGLKTAIIEKLEKEEQSPYEASKKYLIYKLDKNTYNNTANLSSYNITAKSFYKFLFIELSKDEEESIKNIIDKSGLYKIDGDENIIRKLENYLKSNFFVSEIRSPEFEDITTVVKNKTANEVGLIKIYIATLEKFNIKTEVVLTSDRFQTKFDNKFEANNFLTDYLLYFPSIDKFTSPSEINSRIGLPPFELTDNYGLFIKELKVGNFKSGIGKIKFIKATTEKESSDNMIINISFDKDDITLNKIFLERTMEGYYASYLQPYTKLVTNERLDEIYIEVIKSINEGLNIINKSVTNDSPELFGVKPLKINAEMTSNVFVDKAGSKYLFKLGELIGPQIEMYQETERVLPIESDFNRLYKRIITVNIPEGYEFKNLGDINIHHFFDKDKNRILEFHSYYKLENDKLIVYADEYYKLNQIETEVFEKYRSVINAAADFNKIVLMLESKGD